jgi:hypothetical protein
MAEGVDDVDDDVDDVDDVDDEAIKGVGDLLHSLVDVVVFFS